MKTRTSPAAQTLAVNGILLRYYDWEATPGNDKPAMVFAHATGFHGRTFDAIIERFPEHRVLALDLRGHGQSTGSPVSHWRSISDDVVAFLDHLGIVGAIGIGHSMGGHVLVQVASERPDCLAQLVLFDPVILAPEFYADTRPLFTSDHPHPAIRRKRHFTSPQAMIERFASRDPYKLFDPRVFEDYCRYGLTEAEGGGYELACPPEIEASVYASSRSNAGILDAARSISTRTLIVRARQGETNEFKNSPTWPGLADIMAKGTDHPRPDRTHFHPFEAPEDAAAIIRKAIGP